MHQPIQFQKTVPHSISRWLPLRRSLVLIPLVLACFGFSPAMQAVSPPPDGGYAGGNTAEGTQALQSLSTGSANTAIGYQSLFIPLLEATTPPKGTSPFGAIPPAPATPPSVIKPSTSTPPAATVWGSV